jgi:hypothetical protein
MTEKWNSQRTILRGGEGPRVLLKLIQFDKEELIQHYPSSLSPSNMKTSRMKKYQSVRISSAFVLCRLKVQSVSSGANEHAPMNFTSFRIHRIFREY